MDDPLRDSKIGRYLIEYVEQARGIKMNFGAFLHCLNEDANALNQVLWTLQPWFEPGITDLILQFRTKREAPYFTAIIELMNRMKGTGVHLGFEAMATGFCGPINFLR